MLPQIANKGLLAFFALLKALTMRALLSVLLFLASAAGAPTTHPSGVTLQAQQHASSSLLAAKAPAASPPDEGDDLEDEAQMTRRASDEDDDARRRAAVSRMTLLAAPTATKPQGDDADEAGDDEGSDEESEKTSLSAARNDNNTALWWWRTTTKSPPPPSAPPPSAPPSELIALTNGLLNGAVPHIEKYLDDLIFKAIDHPKDLLFDALQVSTSGGTATLSASDIIKTMEAVMLNLAMRDTPTDSRLPPTFAASTVGLDIDMATLITMAGSEQETTGLPTVKVRVRHG